MSLNHDRAQFVERAQSLIEQGYRLEIQSSLPALDRWDEAVNLLLRDVNQALAEGLTSVTLKYQMEHLIELYASILTQVNELQQQKEDETTNLQLRRRAISR